MEQPITAHADPEGEAPWAMQIVVRVEKAAPPTHTETLRAVASAVVTAIASFEAGDDDTRAALERWRSGRIRKVVRRARGAAWNRQLAVPGVVASTRPGSSGQVEVAVHLPGPTDAVAADVARLQVGGFALSDPVREDERSEDAATSGPATSGPATSGPATSGPGAGDHPTAAPVQLWLNPELQLSTGKAAAQVAHATQLVYQTAPVDLARAWCAAGAEVSVEVAAPAQWADLVATSPVVVRDAGFTEIPAGSTTVVASYDL